MTEVITAFCEVARPVMLKILPRNSCIASVRITMECLRRFQVESEPMAVKLAIQAKSLRLAYLTGFDDAERAGQKAAAANYVDMHIHDGWNGHLVLAIKDLNCILDPSFDQCSFPDHGLTVSPCILAIPLPVERTGELEEQRILLGLMMDDGVEVEVNYLPLTDRSFETTEAWEMNEVMRVLVDVICDKMADVICDKMQDRLERADDASKVRPAGHS